MSTKVIPGKGDPCPRCGKPTQMRGHDRIGPEELKRPFFYCRWFYCTNEECKTTTIMPDEFRVFREDLQPYAPPRESPVEPEVERRLANEKQYDYPPWETGT